jgi:hypothetical protein
VALAADCISRAGLRTLARDTLLAAATVAGPRVYDLHGQPAKLTEFPALVVSTPVERKEFSGFGAPQFNTTITLAVMARVAPGSEASAEAQLEQLVEQVQRAVLCTPNMVMPIQRFEFVETQSIVSVEGETMVGEATIMFGCQVPQLYEPDVDVILSEFVTTIPPDGGTGAPVVIDSLPPV